MKQKHTYLAPSYLSSKIAECLATNWLQDFLASDVPNARIMSYGYNSAVAFSKSVAGIEEFARDLLERLRIARKASGAKANQPVIFVCHSMGGLVVKKVSHSLPMRRDMPRWSEPADA